MAVRRNRRLQEETPTRLKLNLCEKTVNYKIDFIYDYSKNCSFKFKCRYRIEAHFSTAFHFLYRYFHYVTASEYYKQQPFTAENN